MKIKPEMGDRNMKGLPWGAPYSDDLVESFDPTSEDFVQQFEPLPAQEEFMFDIFYNEQCRFAWYVGGFGSGKTYIGSQVAIRLGMMAPKGRGLVGRKTLVDLKATTMKTFFEVVDPRLIHSFNRSENLMTLINGHEIYFWGLDDIEKLKSLEIGWFWFDEVDEISVEVFKVAQGRLRNKKQPKRLGYITSNSEGKNWTYKLFVRGETGDGNKLTPEQLNRYWLVRAPSNQNIHLPEDYLDTLNAYTGDMYKRYVLGSFDVFEGQIYPDFKPSVHVVAPFVIPQNWKKIRCMDWGENNPTTCMWLAIDEEGNIWLYKEYYKRKEFTPYHAAEIKRINGDDKIAYTVMDPSVVGRRGTTGKKIDAEYAEYGIRLRMGNNSVDAGIARMHKYLFVDPTRIHPITKTKGSPRFFVFNTCTHFLDEVEGYRRKKVTNVDEDPSEKPLKKDDHTLDAVRYGIMSRPDITIGRVTSMRNKTLPSQPLWDNEKELMRNLR